MPRLSETFRPEAHRENQAAITAVRDIKAPHIQTKSITIGIHTGEGARFVAAAFHANKERQRGNTTIYRDELSERLAHAPKPQRVVLERAIANATEKLDSLEPRDDHHESSLSIQYLEKLNSLQMLPTPTTHQEIKRRETIRRNAVYYFLTDSAPSVTNLQHAIPYLGYEIGPELFRNTMPTDQVAHVMLAAQGVQSQKEYDRRMIHEKALSGDPVAIVQRFGNRFDIEKGIKLLAFYGYDSAVNLKQIEENAEQDREENKIYRKQVTDQAKAQGYQPALPLIHSEVINGHRVVKEITKV